MLNGLIYFGDPSKITGINFRLNGEIDKHGIVRLNYTHSYTSDITAIPHSANIEDGRTLLLIIMKYLNYKLTNFNL